MHVAVVCRDAGGAGSVALVARHQAVELARHGRVTVISNSFTPMPGVEFAATEARTFRFLRRFAHVPHELSFARAVKRELIRRHDIDFVLFHSHVVATVAGVPLTRMRGVPFGIVTHGDIFERPPGSYDQRLTALYKWATPRAYQSAALVVALSKAMAGLALVRGASSLAIEVIPNGVGPEDIGLSAVTPRSSRSAVLRILFAGRLAVEKGVGDLIEAIRLCSSAVHLTIAGSGPLEPRLRELARGLPVTFAGPKGRASLGELYATHDVTCVPSISDPFPGVVLESLAAGTPVLGTNVGGIPDVVRDGVNGLLVPPSNPESLSDAIERLSRDRTLLSALAAAAHDSVLPKYSWSRVGDRLWAAIDSRAAVTTDQRAQR